jgi:hypothetical protein
MQLFNGLVWIGLRENLQENPYLMVKTMVSG